MAIPDYQQIMLPLLKLTSDGREWSLREAVDAVSREFKLTPAEFEERIPSQSMSTIYNRVGWARCDLCASKALGT